MRNTFAAVALCLLGSTAIGAEVSFLGFNEANQPLLRIAGEFVAGDVERFSNAVNELTSAQFEDAMQSGDSSQTPIVIFESPGGNLDVGLEIGNRIRLRGFLTLVADDTECHSACALAWLGGVQRFIGEDALVTFHAAYRLEGELPFEDGLGNALVGSYAANLGLNRDAVIFLTSAPPDGFNALTPSLARKIGLPVNFGVVEPMIRFRRETDDWWKSSPVVDDKQISKSSDKPVPKDHTLVEDAAPLTGVGEAAFQHWLQAAEQGDVDAQFKLAVMHHLGEGVPENLTEAARWYQAAAEQGHVNAQYNLAMMYERGEGVMQNFGEAVRWYRTAANPCDASLAAAFGVPGSFCFRASANRGAPIAQFALGNMYADGKGVAQDDAEAVRWYRMAAERGNDMAQAELGYMYANGRGVVQDDVEAVRWYRMAAGQGNAFAQANLGYMYGAGRGVTEDLMKAYMWSRIAADTGDKIATSNSEFYAQGLGVDAIAEAQSRARVCMASRYHECD